MDRTIIRPFGIETTRIGFGCSSLVGVVTPKEAQTLIDAAFDRGICHFDVARSYGRGAAESVLAKALGPRRKQVTITSKFGLAIPPRRFASEAARTLLRPLLKRVSALRPSVRSSPGSVTAAFVEERVDFSRAHAERSLHTTLQELETDYLDVLLLHEASAEALTDPSLIDFLQNAVREGKIRGYGIGSHLQRIPGLVTAHPDYCPVVQHEWSVLTGAVSIPPFTFRITHGALARSFQQLVERVRKDPAFAKAASDATGVDITSGDKLSAILLRSAALRFSDSITLFSARSKERIVRNIQALGNTQLDEACLKFQPYALKE